MAACTMLANLCMAIDSHCIRVASTKTTKLTSRVVDHLLAKLLVVDLAKVVHGCVVLVGVVARTRVVVTVGLARLRVLAVRRLRTVGVHVLDSFGWSWRGRH